MSHYDEIADVLAKEGFQVSSGINCLGSGQHAFLGARCAPTKRPHNRADTVAPETPPACCIPPRGGGGGVPRYYGSQGPTTELYAAPGTTPLGGTVARRPAPPDTVPRLPPPPDALGQHALPPPLCRA